MSITPQRTPNPNARKYVLPEKHFAQPHSFSTVADAAADPLAARLFALEGVYNVFFALDFVTINKRPDTAWEPLEEQVLAILAGLALHRQLENRLPFMNVPRPLPTLVSSENGRLGMIEAMAILRDGGSALDAVEAATRATEADLNEVSVGRGGLPNVLGEVELDASIMCGHTLRAGAVAAVQGYGYPITLARAVMERLPHVLLAGRGAERFAAEMGMIPEDQRTDTTMARWRDHFGQYGLDPDALVSLADATAALTRPLDLDRFIRNVSAGASLPNPPRDDTKGTVNYLALDAKGDLASAVSTSGIAWKYPGRVGDSPVVGAGNYCDNRYGAAACTGMGELALRAATARSLILYVKMGMGLREAGMETLRDIQALDGARDSYMNIVALAPTGEHAGFTTVPGKRYLYMTASMDEPAEVVRLELPVSTAG